MFLLTLSLSFVYKRPRPPRPSSRGPSKLSSTASLSGGPQYAKAVASWAALLAADRYLTISQVTAWRKLYSGLPLPRLGEANPAVNKPTFEGLECLAAPS
jgi:hypothetical protein